MTLATAPKASAKSTTGVSSAAIGAAGFYSHLIKTVTIIYKVFLTGLALSAASSPLMSAPWLEPGDTRARFALQKLADQGNTELLVTTWPVMWGEVNASTSHGNGKNPESTAMSKAYLNFEQGQQAAQGFRGEFNIQGQSQQPATDDFQTSINGEVSGSLNLQWQGNAWAAGLNTIYVNNPVDNDEFRLDGSYIAAAAGNWAFGAGAIDRWWGPGWGTSLMLSNNARPIESVWFNRNISHAPKSPLLSWLGPWHVTLLAGKNQTEYWVSEASLVAARFTFRPLPRLELGLSSAVIDEDEKHTENSNDNLKLTSLDFRYSQALGPQTSSFYAQALQQHGQTGDNTDIRWLLGTDWTTTLLGADQQWYLEYTNIVADNHQHVSRLTPENSSQGPDYQRSLVSAMNTNSDSLTMGAFHFLNNGANLGASLMLVQQPEQNGPATATFSYAQEVLGGWLKLKASVSDEEIEYANGEKDQIAASASWTYRF